MGSSPTQGTVVRWFKMEDQEFLSNLKAQVWAPFKDGRGYYESRTMTKDELARLMAIAAKHIVTIHNACMGFGIGMAIYEEPEAPTYPGVTPDPPKTLFFVTSQHITDKGGHFKEGWALFSPLALRPENVAKCKEYGLEIPENRPEKYDY